MLGYLWHLYANFLPIWVLFETAISRTIADITLIRQTWSSVTARTPAECRGCSGGGSRVVTEATLSYKMRALIKMMQMERKALFIVFIGGDQLTDWLSGHFTNYGWHCTGWVWRSILAEMSIHTNYGLHNDLNSTSNFTHSCCAVGCWHISFIFSLMEFLTSPNIECI